jgi:hypothetical protein
MNGIYYYMPVFFECLRIFLKKFKHPDGVHDAFSLFEVSKFNDIMLLLKGNE